DERRRRRELLLPRVALVELLDEAVGVEPERVGVGAQERARVDPSRQEVEAVRLERREVAGAHAGQALGVGEREALTLARRSKAPPDLEQASPTVDAASGKRELDLPLVLRDRLDAHLDRVAEAVGTAGAAAHERRARRVQLEELARQPPGRQEPLEDAAEAGEEAGAEKAGDLALERLLPAALDQPVLEQPREAELVGRVLDLGRLALA